MLALTLYQLGQLYRHELPELVAAAEASGDAVQFRRRLGEWVSRSESAQGDAGEQIRLLIDYDGREVDELSTGERMPVRTLTLLWQFLTGCLENVEMRTDLFIDLFYLFKRLGGAELPPLSMQRVRIRSERWPSGLDAEVREIRADNRERMLHLLVQKIENRKSTPSRFRFAEGMSYEDKYRQVAIWWNDFRFHLAMAVKSPSELNRFLGNSLSAETMYLLSKARKKGMPFFATPYYLSLLDVTGKGYGDEAIRSYILYSPQLVETYGSIRAWEKEDVVEAGKPNAAGWLLPDGHNIHRRYPEVAILIPDTMGRACGGLCASCQRMYDFQSERLNFEFESLRPKESWDHKLRRLMTYFEEDTQLRDILITGGDALMSQNKTLHNILEAVYRMACRKRKANAGRPDGEKYAELQRVRLGSRLPAYLPMRIDDDPAAAGAQCAGRGLLLHLLGEGVSGELRRLYAQQPVAAGTARGEDLRPADARTGRGAGCRAGEGRRHGRTAPPLYEETPAAVPCDRPQRAEPAGHRQEHVVQAGGHYARRQAHPALRP